MPHGYLHFNICALLGISFIRKMPEGRIYRFATTAVLLWTGFGAAGTLFFAVLFACLEAYVSAGGPCPVPSWIQQALAARLADWLAPIKLVAMRILQKLDRYICEAQEGISVALALAWRLALSSPCIVAGIGREQISSGSCPVV